MHGIGSLPLFKLTAEAQMWLCSEQANRVIEMGGRKGEA